MFSVRLISCFLGNQDRCVYVVAGFIISCGCGVLEKIIKFVGGKMAKNVGTFVGRIKRGIGLWNDWVLGLFYKNPLY